jgi:hypothetical protein
MIDYEITAEALLRLTRWWSANEVWDRGMAFTMGPVFEEAYEIRAVLVADKVLHLGQARPVAQAFCDRALLTQGVVEEDMFFMGYAAERDAQGVPDCSCVADASSTVITLLETVQAYPDTPRAPEYVAGVRRFADYVLEHYVDPAGVIGVGILGHQRNPWPRYWCANALFTPVLLSLHKQTGEAKYLEAALAPLSYLASYDYRDTADKSWGLCATEVVLYGGEGLVAGLKSPEACAAPVRELSGETSGGAAEPEAAAALNRVRATEQTAIGEAEADDGTLGAALQRRWQEFLAWLYANQGVGGLWQDTLEYRCYQLGLSWLLAEATEGQQRSPEIESMMDRQMHCLVSAEGRDYHGLFCRPFAMALAHLSAARIAALCAAEAGEQFAQALTEAGRKVPPPTW